MLFVLSHSRMRIYEKLQSIVRVQKIEENVKNVSVIPCDI